MRKEERMRNPSRSCSIIFNGADELAFGLLNFITTTKNVEGHALKVRLKGVLEHCTTSRRLTLITLMKVLQIAANHVAEAIHRFINAKSSRGGLPRKLYVQMDNCTRKNKNKSLFAHLECLIF